MTATLTSLDHALIGALHRVLGKGAPPIALHEPQFGERESELVQDCLDTTFVSSVGKYVDQFERMLCEYTGSKHAIAVANGTAALHLALVVAGVRPGDEVLVPSLSFVATANSVSHAGAITHFVDSDPATLGMDPLALDEYLARIAERTGEGLRNRSTGRRISAVVPMHAYGHPVNLDALIEVAGKYGVVIVEDATESLGSTYHGKHAGTFGLLGTLSFNGNKIITTGGGGAILTDNAALGARAKHLTTTAKIPHRWDFVHDEVAWNYRLPNLNAALGCAQMERLPDYISRKRALAEKYKAAFAGVTGLHFVNEPAGSRSNYWLNSVLLDEPSMDVRNQLLTAANDAGYQCRPTWTLLHKLTMYAAAPRAPLPVAERIEASLINIPSSPKLADRTESR